jgi:protein TonB
MHPFTRHTDREHLGAGAITIAVHALLGLALLLALTQRNHTTPPQSTTLIAVSDLPPVPPPPPSHRHGGAHKSTSPPKGPLIKNQPVAAPRAPAMIPTVAPPIPLSGITPASGGTGGNGGGVGGGNGNGQGGSGAGMGDDGSPPERIRGKISDRDYPRSLSDAGVSGTVAVRYRVGVDGRVSDCRITHSSGSGMLDELTCQLIEQRFRFRPARDGEGHPVPSVIIENHSWIIPAAVPEGEPPQE